MQQIGIRRPRVRREHRWHEVLLLGPRDLNVVRPRRSPVPVIALTEERPGGHVPAQPCARFTGCYRFADGFE